MLTKSQAKVFFLGGTFVFSVAFLGLTYDTHMKVPAQTNEDKITDDVVAGKKIWERNNCMGCHTLFGEGGYYAPELTKVVKRRGKPWIRIFMKDPQRMFPGERKMVQYNFTDAEIEQIIAFFEWAGQVDLNGFPADPPLAAAPTGAGSTTLNQSSAPITDTPALIAQPEILKTVCSACHSIAGVGGAVGPALDSVKDRYTKENLFKWLKNPQEVKPGTAMPNLGLSDETAMEIVEYLSSLNQ